MFMESKNKNSTKKGCVSPDVLESARLISKLKGEDFDALEANFITNYVLDNQRLLTEQARLSMQEKKGITNART
jgi:hypothetical protein